MRYTALGPMSHSFHTLYSPWAELIFHYFMQNVKTRKVSCEKHTSLLLMLHSKMAQKGTYITHFHVILAFSDLSPALSRKHAKAGILH